MIPQKEKSIYYKLNIKSFDNMVKFYISDGLSHDQQKYKCVVELGII